MLKIEVGYFDRPYRTLSILAVLLIGLVVIPPDSRAFAATNYAVFTLNQDFDELTRSKARMLYRGKAKSLQGK